MGHMRFPIPWCALRQRETFGSVRCWEDSLHNPVGEPLLRQSFISGWIITAVKQLGHINTHSECGQCRFTSHTDEGSSLPQMEKDEGKKWEAEKRVPEACTDEAWRSPSLYWRQQRGRSKQPSIMKKKLHSYRVKKWTERQFEPGVQLQTGSIGGHSDVVAVCSVKPLAWRQNLGTWAGGFWLLWLWAYENPPRTVTVSELAEGRAAPPATFLLHSERGKRETCGLCQPAQQQRWQAGSHAIYQLSMNVRSCMSSSSWWACSSCLTWLWLTLGLTHQHTPCVYSAVCWVIDWILLAFGLAWICILRL